MALLEEGQNIRGVYTVERFLGEGRFAEVYRVKHRFLGRQAMKVFKSAGMNVQVVEQALRTAIVLSRMGHRSIVRVFDVDVVEISSKSFSFFTMEYAPGGNLEQFWRSYGSIFVPVDTTVEIIRQICRGMAVAHGDDPPLIHGNIKPSNILIEYDALGLRALVSDFGLTKVFHPSRMKDVNALSFEAPENFSDPNRVSCAGDVWALGSTLYLLLTDRLPYPQFEDLVTVDAAIFERPIIPAGRLNIMVDDSLDGILSRALAVKPVYRYPTASEMLADLDKWKPGGERVAVALTEETFNFSPGMKMNVFICAKSADYSYARRVFEFLRSHQISVFLSDQSLPELGNSDYGKVIDLALDKAQHMIVVTSSKENVEASWVEAEWRFFINEKRSGRKTGNLLTVVIGDLSPSELPPSLRNYEVLPFQPEGIEKLLGYVRPRDSQFLDRYPAH